jgi:hypothetical protein
MPVVSAKGATLMNQQKQPTKEIPAKDRLITRPDEPLPTTEDPKKPRGTPNDPQPPAAEGQDQEQKKKGIDYTA